MTDVCTEYYKDMDVSLFYSFGQQESEHLRQNKRLWLVLQVLKDEEELVSLNTEDRNQFRQEGKLQTHQMGWHIQKIETLPSWKVVNICIFH